MDQKENIICTTDDVRGYFLGQPHVTTLAGVIAYKDLNFDPLRAVNILNQKGMCHTAVLLHSSLISDPLDQEPNFSNSLIV